MKVCPLCNKQHRSDKPCPAQKDRLKSGDLLIGRTLDGKYILEYLISRGGMASIYSARRPQIGDEVAVKVLKLDADLDPTDLKRFRLEAASAASIKHQNVVSIYDFGLNDDIAYIVMERLEGPALSKEIRAHGSIDPERALGIFKQVCAAVAAAHKQGVIHRDLKPSNIIFQHAECEDDLVKVVDFGVAKLLRNQKGEKLTSADFAVGTPEYMSPEQCLGHKVSERSDVYSLGIALYEMLSGEVPFYNTVASAILVQHAIESPRPPSRLNPAIPPEIDAVILKALEKNPEKRFRSAIEMATEFELACRSADLKNRSLLQEEISSNREQDNGSGKNRKLTPSERDEIALDTRFPHLPSPTEGIKAVTGARAHARFSFERFVGRDEELRKLEERFEQSVAGHSRTVFIIGDPGVGKTELVNRFHLLLGPEAALFISGKFYEYGGDSPYRPYLDGINSMLQGSSEAQNLLQPSIEGLEEKLRHRLDEIDRLVNLSLGGRASSVEEQNKYRTFELLVDIFKTISESIPIALFLDDLQWADPLSLEFLSYFIRNTEESRILFICTSRTQELADEALPVKSWLRRISRSNGYEQLKLSALSAGEARALIDSIFGDIKIGENVVLRLYETSEGNPYYLGELLRQLIQDRKIIWSGDRWECAEIEEIVLPGSILDLVELRLVRLTDETVEVLTRAAVTGEKFSFHLLLKITDLSKDALMDIIDIGLREFIIKESSGPDLEDDYFVFYHGTIQKALYDRLSSYRRRRLHVQIGSKLETLNSHRLDFISGELAYHFHHGGNQRKTICYGINAGEAARSIFAVEEAVKYYSWAEESLRELSEAGEKFSDLKPELMIAFRLGYGETLMHLGRNETAGEQFETALRLSQDAALVQQQGKALRAMGELAWSRGQYDEALSFCESALHLLGESGDLSGECRLFAVIGNAYFSQGIFDQAIEFYQKSLEMARMIGDRAGEGEALRNIGLINGRNGDGETAFDYLEKALAIARAIEDRESERQILLLIGNVHFEQDALDKAAENWRQSLRIARAIGRRRGECRVMLNIGEICRRKGDLEGAKRCFNEAHSIAAEIQDREPEGHALSNLGLVHQSLGEKDKAFDCFQRALEIFRETHYRSDAEAEALSGIARIFLERGRVSDAKRYYEMAVASGRELGLWNLVVPSLRDLAACENTLGHRTGARRRLSEALTAIDDTMNADLPETEKSRCSLIRSQLAQDMAALEAK